MKSENFKTNFLSIEKKVKFRHKKRAKISSYFKAACRIRTNDPEITNHVLWPAELRRHT